MPGRPAFCLIDFHYVNGSCDRTTGGTGRFADASGTFTTTSLSTPVSTVGSIETFSFTQTTTGQISY